LTTDGPITHWGTNFHRLDGLFSAGGCAPGGQPTFLIIGRAPWDLYSNANPSIANQQPVIQNTGRFTLNVGGVSSSTPITGVTFEFGTTQTLLGVVTPGPIVGAGMPGLVMACRGLLAFPTSSPEIV
jgi:hypothetical protein